jgi:hypothetical protein
MSATDWLIALLEHGNPGNPGVRQVTGSLRRTPQVLAERFDHYQNLVGSVGAEQAACIVINAARATHRGWLAG